MKIKKLIMGACVAFSGLLVIGYGTTLKKSENPQKIDVKSELSYPVVLENSQNKNYLKVLLSGFDTKNIARAPINLSLVIDRSTSMHGERIERAREAAILAINMLDKNDIFSLVVYDSDARILIPATKVMEKNKLINTVNSELTARGMTALFAGVSLGIKEVERFLDKDKVNRIILLSDGQANTGPTSIEELSGLAKIAARKGIAITTIGLGSGYNERLMSSIAGYSDGNHIYAKEAGDLEKAFVHEFEDVMSVIAQNVEVIIKLNGKTKAVRLLGREGSIKGNKVTVNLNQLYANQEKYVLLEIETEKGSDQESKEIANVTVNYRNVLSNHNENHRNNVVLGYSASQEMVGKFADEEILADMVTQETIIAQEEALEFMEIGDYESADNSLIKAKETIQRNAKSINFSRPQMDRLNSLEKSVPASAPATMDNKKEFEEKVYQEKAQNRKFKSDK